MKEHAEQKWTLETLMTKGEQLNRNHKPHYIRKSKIKMWGVVLSIQVSYWIGFIWYISTWDKSTRYHHLEVVPTESSPSDIHRIITYEREKQSFQKIIHIVLIQSTCMYINTLHIWHTLFGLNNPDTLNIQSLYF